MSCSLNFTTAYTFFHNKMSGNTKSGAKDVQPGGEEPLWRMWLIHSEDPVGLSYSESRMFPAATQGPGPRWMLSKNFLLNVSSSPMSSRPLSAQRAWNPSPYSQPRLCRQGPAFHQWLTHARSFEGCHKVRGTVGG